MRPPFPLLLLVPSTVLAASKTLSSYDSPIEYTGSGWKVAVVNASGAQCNGSPTVYSTSTPGDAMRFSFIGDSITVYGQQPQNSGHVFILDGEMQQQPPSPVSSSDSSCSVLFARSSLSNDSHNLAFVSSHSLLSISGIKYTQPSPSPSPSIQEMLASTSSSSGTSTSAVSITTSTTTSSFQTILLAIVIAIIVFMILLLIGFIFIRRRILRARNDDGVEPFDVEKVLHERSAGPVPSSRPHSPGMPTAVPVGTTSSTRSLPGPPFDRTFTSVHKDLPALPKLEGEEKRAWHNESRHRATSRTEHHEDPPPRYEYI